MISKELEKQIAKDQHLKTLTNLIRTDLETRLAKNPQEAIAETLVILNNNLEVIEEYLLRAPACLTGPLKECLQLNSGFETDIVYKNGRFYLSLKHCAHWYFEHKNEEMKKHFTYVDYNLDEFSETIEDYLPQLENDTDVFNGQEIQQRKLFLGEAIRKIKDSINVKGFYLHGEPGVGKTTLLKILANTIAIKTTKTVAFINMSNLINLSKQSLSDKSARNQKQLLDKLKYADIFFLDDLGGENVSTWSRDEILVYLLSYRMEKRKLTFFSSNFSMLQLQKNYLLKKDQYPIEKIKQKRFFERIKALSEEFHLEGESHRG